MNTRSDFNVVQAAQVAAYFAKANGGSINVLKLVKLIYLADRHSMSLFDFPILNDSFVSMDKGPVNSRTYDRLKSNAQPENEWLRFVAMRKGHEITLADPKITVKDLNQLSRADLRVLGETWNRYGHLDSYTLVKLTHEFCPEWNDPNGSSSEIPFERIFQFLGRDNPAELAALINEQRAIDREFKKTNG